MRAHYALLAICVFACLPGVALADGVDTTPPTIAALVPSPSEIWPANHKMVPVTIDTLVIDDSDPAPFVHIISVTSDDPSFMADDYEITGDLSLNLRAEKTQKNGRLYVIYVEAVDASGNTSLGMTTVRIGHTTGHDQPF
jgi:hypothetical protein